MAFLSYLSSCCYSFYPSLHLAILSGKNQGMNYLLLVYMSVIVYMYTYILTVANLYTPILMYNKLTIGTYIGYS